MFLEKAGTWLRAAADFLKPYLQTSGGPIALWQLCNEIPGMQAWLAGMDRSPDAIGMGRDDGLYPTFLKGIYRTAEKLSEAYGVQCASIADLTWEFLAKANVELVELDYSTFYHEVYLPAYVQWLEATVRNAGIDVPLTTNSGQANEATVLRESALRNPNVLFGVDCYYAHAETAIGTVGLSYGELGASLTAECFSEPATIWEAQCGYCLDYPRLEPDDIYLSLMWSYISGFKGQSLYLFAGGDNRPGLGCHGTYHDYQAPIGADGSLKPHYYAIQRAFSDIGADPWILESDRVCDLSIGIYARERVDALAHLLFLGSISYNVIDVRHSSVQKMAEHPFIWLRGREEMDAKTQERLLEYVSQGGKLLIDQTVPSKDANHDSAPIISEALGVSIRRGNDRTRLLKIGNNEIPIGAEPGIISGGEEVLGANLQGDPSLVWLAYGRGQVVIAPFDMKYMMQSQFIYLNTVLSSLGVKRLVDSKELRGQVRQGRDGSMRLYVLNPYRHHVHEEIAVGGRNIVLDLAPLAIVQSQFSPPLFTDSVCAAGAVSGSEKR